MRSHESVIVSVQFRGESYDMELPTFLQIGDLTEKIEETFMAMYPERFPMGKRLSLIFDGHVLKDEDTLASRGIWDGSDIICSVGGE